MMREELDGLIRDGVAAGAAPGVVVVVVDRDGEVYAGAAGERHVGGGDEMTLDTVGAIFSMTKAITGLAAMQLVERGLLSLDAPMTDVVADVGPLVVLEGFDADGAPITRPAASVPTLRQLLTHTSGYVYDMWNADIPRWHEATGTPSFRSLQRDSLRTPLVFDPGTRWDYGIGIDWVGLIVEAVSGRTLGEYLAEHVTGPLGMVDTTFAPTADLLARAASVHARGPDGSLTPIDLPAPRAPEFEMGGGGLYGTMPDYARFLRMILNDGEVDGERIVDAATVEQMATNQIGDLRVRPLVSVAPELTNDAELYPDVDKSWGLTFQIHEADGATGCPAGTLSWAGLANSYYWADRTNGVAGAYLTQILPFADAASIGLFYDVQRAVYDSLPTR